MSGMTAGGGSAAGRSVGEGSRASSQAREADLKGPRPAMARGLRGFHYNTSVNTDPEGTTPLCIHRSI
eukprot:scaffold10678_cov70-Phaeocystis_antarctica.AAC.1